MNIVNLATIDFKGSGITPPTPLPDQSDATITPSTVLNGYIGYNNYNRVVGTFVAPTGGSAQIEQSMEDFGYADSIDFIQWMVDYSNTITSGWTEYTTSTVMSGELIYFAPNLPINGLSFANGFHKCENLLTIPSLNTSNLTNFQGVFSGCTSLVSVPDLDLHNANTLNYCFRDNNKLRSIGLIDLTSYGGGTAVAGPFYGNSTANATTNRYPSLTDLLGFPNLKNPIYLNGCQSLTAQSLVNVFNNLADLSSTTSQTIFIGDVNLAKLTPVQIQIATNKNWVVS